MASRTELIRAGEDATAVEHHQGAEFHVHEGAGHAFDNYNAAMMHHERAAREAWAQTADFLKRTLPV
jgi:carboxymethylenebutenolidase